MASSSYRVINCVLDSFVCGVKTVGFHSQRWGGAFQSVVHKKSLHCDPGPERNVLLH